MKDCLTPQSIQKLIEAFPKLRKEIFKHIKDEIVYRLNSSGRLPGQYNEELELTGLCCDISYYVGEIIKKAYPEAKSNEGRFRLDKHPRFAGRKDLSSIHTWLEIGDKIVDFTVQQFQPFCNEKIPQVLITDINDHRYLTYKKNPKEWDVEEVGLDGGVIFEHYVNNLGKESKLFRDAIIKFAKFPDIFLYTFVPQNALKSIKQKGLLSAAKLIDNKEALKLARPKETKEFKNSILEKLDDPEWTDIVSGVSAFFTLPDFTKITSKHNIRRFGLVPIMINLSQIMKSYPKTRLIAVELKQYKESMSDAEYESRQKDFSLKEVQKYTEMNPKDLWKHYDDPSGKYYASDVPHLIILTPQKKIPAKFLKF